jgi:hypothetical protein
MSGDKTFGEWCARTQGLGPMSAVQARDLMVECFYEAQKAMFERSKQRLGTDWNEESVRRSVTAAVRAGFEQVGEDFEHPTKQGIIETMTVLGRKARSWGTPNDIIEHHKQEMENVIALIEE